MRKWWQVLMGLVVVGVVGAAQIEIVFWTAPNPSQEVFWRRMAEAYMAEHPEVKISVSPMPEAPTSEAGILAAIAGGVAPTASENVFVGFGDELVRSQAIVPWNAFANWDQVVAARAMEETIKAWVFPDGNHYIIPLYVNAMLVAWRIDILRELGYEKPPRTYSEVLAVGKRLKEVYPDKFLWLRSELEVPTWWQRWFDFFVFYYAASGGQPIITEPEITADDEAAVAVLGFFKTLRDQELLITEPLATGFEEGKTIMTVLGPWTFPWWKENYPELVYGETYVLTPPPVPDNYPADKPVYTFADAKGLVLYAQATPQQRQAMWDFIAWVLSNPEHDLLWIQTTGMLPARDDVGKNPLFLEYIKEKEPALLDYAAAIPYAVPPIFHYKYVDIQELMGLECIYPVLIGELTPEEGWEAWKAAVKDILK
ncbi:carbohydrate ABC transporter substrate-binding protein [Candidatus Bipolaricaulota bacterium]|nr:carbohydrate ABC transporter substrate-binding protein [Candidatus Bipolaricaulota bacterium]